MGKIASLPKMFRYGIGRRLILWILLFSSVVTFGGTFLSLYLDYARDLTEIHRNLAQVETSHLPGVANSMWVANRKILEIQLEGILRLPDMAYLEILEGDKVFMRVGERPEKKIITRRYPLVYSYRGKEIRLGTLVAVVSLSGIYQRLLDRVLVILATQAVKTLLVSTFIFFLFHFMVGRHLAKMAEYTRFLGAGSLAVPLALARSRRRGGQGDELDQLVRSINGMRQTLDRDFTEREETEAELRRHRDRLEELAGERTAELEKSNRGLQQEIYRRRKAQMELDSIIRTIPDIIYRSDADGVLTFVSDAVKRYGYWPEALVGTSLLDLVHPDDRDAAISRINERRTGKRRTRSFELRLRTRNRGEVLFEVFSLSVEGLYATQKSDPGAFRGTQGIAKDITERKQAEEKIRRMNDELEERVARRTEELIRSSRELAASRDTIRETRNRMLLMEKMAALGLVVADSTHEINTPLSIGITTATFFGEKTEALREHYRAGKMARSDFETFMDLAEESSGIIHANLTQSAELIRGLKEVAVDQCTDDRRQFMLCEYIGVILLSLRPHLKKTRHIVSVSCPGDLTIESYPGAFFQIITNLVMNSLIHGFEEKRKGTISITVSRLEGVVELQYSDDGRGIDPKHIDRIFDSYFTTKRMEGGSGIGCHIIHSLVTEKLKGEITCTSRPGEGAVFIITLPDDPVRDVSR